MSKRLDPPNARWLLFALAAMILGSAAVAEQDVGWPREVETPRGRVVIYQPQVEAFENARLHSRSAFSVTTPTATEPVFGVLWSTARVSIDRDDRTVDIVGIDVTDLRFPDATDEQEVGFKQWVEAEVEGWELTLSLDRLLTNLAVVERVRLASEDLEVDPPVILYADYPSVLIAIDGEPRFAPLPEDESLKTVVNTPYRILLEAKKKSRTYWLDGGTHWYRAERIEGPWTAVKKPPKKIRKQRTDDEQTAADEAAAEAKAEGIDTVPRVIVATQPTELVVTEGSAEYVSIQGTDLLYASNTENDLLKHVATQRNYLLLSGRWYTSTSLDGAWTYVRPDALPEDFAKIPPESEQGELLAFVAGTEQAREALMDDQIPQTAAIRRGPGNVAVEYDGNPRFEPIEGTAMQYAVNTASAVLLIDGKYWLCEQAVWYVGANADGPWQVATYRPDEIEHLPPSNPHYNVKYVYVYDSTPEVVYTGYTPGYTGSYQLHGCIVYGTGFWYHPWVGRAYFPFHATWGFRVRWSPWWGWGVGVGWSNGPFTISIGFGRPRGGWWGPRGFAMRPVVRPGRPVFRPPVRPGRPGTRPPGGATRPPRAQPMPAARAGGGGDSPNLYNRSDQSARMADRAAPRREPGAAPGDRSNNLYAGSDGGVYRRNQDGSWQQRSGDRWQSADPAKTGGREGAGSGYPSRASGENRPGTGGDRPAAQPSTQPRQRSPGSTGTSGRGGSSLQRDHSARQRGASRTNQYNRSRSGSSAGAQRSMRSGGGRRR